MTILYIAPASGDTHHPQSRIYAYEGERPKSVQVRDHYRQHPELWRECGLVNFEGKLVSFAGSDAERQELLDCQPLAAGLVIEVD